MSVNYPQVSHQNSHPHMQGAVGGDSNGDINGLNGSSHGLPPQNQQQQYPQFDAHHQGQPPQQQNYSATPPQSNGNGLVDEGLSMMGSGGENQKGNRLRKACDSCSIRKVKCDESGPPCRACSALDIPCTFERPSRRRGPPNRHAEAIKRRRLESPGFSSPASPNNAAAALASLSTHAVLSAESICPFSTLELLVDDFFTYIHPLVPFPHEPSFRGAFKAREDLINPSFLALLASMVGTLVASFPRKPRLHLKAQHRENLFPNSISLVERCHKVAVEARGAGYLDRELTVYDAATSYFLGLAGAYTINWKQCRLYFAETLSIARSIGVLKIKDPGQYAVGQLPGAMGADGPGGYVGATGEPVDYIRQEIGRRIFWVMFVGVRSMQQLGASFPELIIPPPTRSDPYPPLPMEVDDQYIYVSHVDPQPAGLISELTGFNLNVQAYLSYTPLSTMELAYGVDEIFDWNKQRRVLEECLRAVKRCLELVPRELMLTPSSQPGEFEPHVDRQYFPPASEFPGARAGEPNTAEQDRRRLQYEIQKANIYASQLGTRSHIVEKYWDLFDANSRLKTSNTPSAASSPGVAAGVLDGMLATMGGGNANGNLNPTSTGYDLVETQMTNEREKIVKDLLMVLGSISQVNMEPNGSSFINKIRQIASTLLDDPRNRKGPLALRAEEYLARFLDVLMKLEGASTSPSAAAPPTVGAVPGTTDWEADEEEELRNWADLREFQTRFAKSGGFMNE